MVSALEVKEAVKTHLLKIPGVVGVGVGRSLQEVIRVYVERWVPEIPAEIAGFPVEVVVSGRFKALSLMPPVLKPLERTEKLRPCPGGVSIGHYLISAGTLGVRVFDSLTREKLILSNNHVIANSDSEETVRASLGDPILQPGPIDGGVSPEDDIGYLHRWVRLRELGSNYVDCAVAKPLESVDDYLADEILDVGLVTAVILEPEVGMAIQKSGRTTGVTSG